MTSVPESVGLLPKRLDQIMGSRSSRMGNKVTGFHSTTIPPHLSGQATETAGCGRSRSARRGGPGIAWDVCVSQVDEGWNGA